MQKKFEMLPPGFEPGLSARKAEVLDRTTPWQRQT